MKRLGRIAAAFMASVFFLTGIPAMTAFAADEIPAAEEVVTETPAVEPVAETPVPETPAPETPEPVVVTPENGGGTPETPVVTDDAQDVTTDGAIIDGTTNNGIEDDKKEEGKGEPAANGGAGISLLAAGDDTKADSDQPIAEEFAYSGDELNFITAENAGFGMYTAQEGTKAELSGDKVIITYYPKNTSVYTGLFFDADNTVTSSWQTYYAITEGVYRIELSKSYCGKAWPVAIVKADMTSTPSAQYYLAIPSEDKLAPAEPERAHEFAYSGDELNFITAENAGFGMYTAQEGTKAELSGDKVIITYYPKNTSVYTGLFFDADNTVTSSWQTYYAITEGVYRIELSKSYCGKAWPVAIVKADMTSTPSAQYYLAIPSEDKLAPAEPERAHEFAYSGDELNFITAENAGFGMYTAQEGTKAELSGDKVIITYYPKNTSVYTGLFFDADNTVTSSWQTYYAITEGVYRIELSKSYCGKAWPVAIVKADMTSTPSAQYYLAIPSEDKLAPAEPERAHEFAYSGDELNFITAENAGFGMYTAQEGTKAELSGDKVIITYYPKNTSVYTGLFFDADNTVTSSWQTYYAITEGVYRIELSKSYCGKAWPVAIVKADMTSTPSAQYYLAIPSEDKLAPAEPEPESIELTIENITGMFKAVTASLEKKDGKTELVVALSGTGYHELFKGTYEQAVANGANTANWIHGAINAGGKWEFRIPVSDGENYIPIVAISDSYYQKYLNGENVIDRAFYPRQFTLDVSQKKLTTDDYSNTQTLTVVNNVKMFKPQTAVLETVGGPNSNSYKSNLVLTMGSTSFDKVCYGTKDQAETATQYEAAGGTTFEFPVRWVEEFGKPETMQTVIGKPVIMSFHSVSKNEWYERKVTINEENGTITFDEVTEEDSSGGGDTPTPTPSGDGSEDGGSNTGGSTAAVDNSTSLADGVYTPDSFSFSGGSGRLTITCRQVEVRDGKAYATLVFQNTRSGNTEMTYVKASGGIYYCTKEGGASVVTIPVALNKNNTIIGMTTAMSQAHEVEYTIFVYIAGADAQEGGALSDNEELDKEAPVIPGLKFVDEEKLEYAENFKIFNYTEGVRLLEIDMRLRDDDKDDAKKDDGKSSTQIDETTKKNAALHDDEDSLIDTQEVPLDEADNDGITTTADAQAELYKGNVIKYLLVPENVEIPAGLEKEVIVINLPVESVYSGSDEIRDIFKELKIEDLITSQVEEDKDNKDIVAAGDYKDLDLKALIKSKCDLVILPEDSIEAEDVKDEKAQKEAKENFEKLAEDLANLEVPVLVDRADYEETDNAKAEWIKIFGILFNCEKEANALFETMTK